MADLTQTPEQVQADLDAVEASKVGLASISDSADTRSTAVKKSGFHSLEENSANAPNTERAVLISAVRDTAASGEIRYGQIAITESGKLYWAEDVNGTLGAWNEGVSIAEAQTLTNKTLTNPDINGGTLDNSVIGGDTPAAATVTQLTSGGDILSDTDSTDSIGSTAVRWLKGWFDTLTAGTLTIGAGSIVDSSGAIDFGNENLSTTGTLDAGNTDITGTLDVSGNTALAGDLDVTGVTKGGGAYSGDIPTTSGFNGGGTNVVGQYQFTAVGGAGGYGAGFGASSYAGAAQVSMGKIVWDGIAAWNGTAANQDSKARIFTAVNGVETVAATFIGANTTLAGALAVTGNLAQSISTAGGNNNLSLRNTNAGATASTNINLGTDLSTATATITTFSEAHTNAGKLVIHTGANRDLVLGTNGADRVTIDGSTGGVTLSSDLDVTGAVSKGSGSFKISHPLPELTDTHHLVHSFTESPQADLLYSGVADLVDGKASINIDEFHSMTEGTFEALCRNVRTFSSNETGFHHVRCSVEGNILSLDCEDSDCTDTVSWLVIGERKDQHMFDTGWTNENGEVIVEPLKPEPVPEPEPVQRTVRVAITEEYNQIIPAVLDDAGEIVEEERTERAIRQVTKIETVDVSESIEIIDGVATLIPATTEEKPVPQFETLAVFDTEGNPVY